MVETKTDIINKINDLNDSDLERVRSLIKSINIDSNSQKNEQIPIFPFLIIAMIIGFFTKDMDNLQSNYILVLLYY